MHEFLASEMAANVFQALLGEMRGARLSIILYAKRLACIPAKERMRDYSAFFNWSANPCEWGVIRSTDRRVQYLYRPFQSEFLLYFRVAPYMKYAIAVALIFPILASANDSVGGISAGGIVLRSTDAIAMKKEVLNISHRRISVDYEFLNESAKDVEETIIFPLPVYSAYGMEGDSYQGQPPSFSIVVDGKPVQFQTIVQAFLDGIDVTTQLRKAGLSDAQIAFPPFKKAGIPPLSDQQRLRLGKLKLFGETIIGDIGPLWKIQVNYVWQQKFPANKVVKVHHAYRPFISTGPGQWRMDEETARRYCADPQFLASWKKLAKRESSDGSMLIAAKVGYVVKTGNNWKNGIEDFTLNLIKEKPSELVSVCFPGTFKKIDAKTYQVRLRNFRPSQDLDVYFGNVDIAGDAYKGELPVLRK